MLSVSGSFGGVPFAFACDQDDPSSRFARQWTSAVGDINASFSCTDASSLSVSLRNPTPGTFTDPSSGPNFFYQDASGTWLSWYDATPLAWSVTLDAVTWLDLETFQVDGSLAGAWEAAGKPPLERQHVQQRLADVATEIEAARLLIQRAAWMGRAGVPMTGGQGSMSKLKGGDVAMWVATEAVQILGGYGYIKEYPVERFMRDAKITQIYEGTQEVQRLVIAREMLRESRAFLLAGVG